jgi:predicted MFS family arabinose efflux permease
VRSALFPLYEQLRDRFGIQDAKLGLLTTAFIVPHALATLPFGWAGDRYDRRRVIACGLLLASLASAAGALATDVTTLALSRAMVGLGTAAIVPVANSILGQLYEGPQKASRISIFNLGILLGALVGLAVAQAAGFPLVVVLLAAPSAILALVLVVMPVPAHPGASRARATSYRELAKQFLAESRELLGIRTLRWVILSTTAMAFAAGGYSAWLIDFLHREKHMSEKAATTLLGLTGIGALAGIVFGGRLADRMRRRSRAGRVWTIALGMTLSIPAAVACIELPPGPLLYVAGIATMFFISWYHAPMAASVDDLAPPARTVAAQGLVIFTMHLLGTAPASYVLGAVSDAYSLYTAMYVATAALVIAAIAMFLARPSFAIDSIAARGSDAARGYQPTDSMG